MLKYLKNLENRLTEDQKEHILRNLKREMEL